jgi:uncharacterized repeat protein (TIGR01451 family)
MAGQEFTATITVTNNGSGVASGVVVTDDLPANTTFVSCTATGGGVCGGSGNNRTVTFDTLASGASATITFVATLDCGIADGATVANTATVTASTQDTDPGNNAATATLTADDPPPTITCPPNQSAIATSPAGAVVTYPAPIVSDNCPGVTLVTTPPSGSTFPIGRTTVTAIATDTSGNQATCSFIVSVSGTLTAVKDSFLRQGSNDTNEGAGERLRIQNSGNNRALVAFDLSGVSTAGLISATLVLTIAENADNWGPTGRPVDVHRLLTSWAEGNGRNTIFVGGGPTVRGTGPGVTWHCAIDANISNTSPDGPFWNGGVFAAATAPSAVHLNDVTGEVSWDVTADVLAGAGFGWLVKKQSEGQNGQARYYSREGAVAAGNPSWAPRLILNYGP